MDRIVNPPKKLDGLGDGGLYRLFGADIELNGFSLEVRVGGGSFGLSNSFFAPPPGVQVSHNNTGGTLLSKSQAACSADSACYPMRSELWLYTRTVWKGASALGTRRGRNPILTSTCDECLAFDIHV